MRRVLGGVGGNGGGRPSQLSHRYTTHIRTHARPSLWCSKIPTVLKVVPSIPRNAMGKVGKKALRAELWPELAAAPVSPVSPKQ